MLDKASAGSQRQVELRLIPSLSARVLQIKQDKELALWYGLRSLDTQGSGVINTARAIEQLQYYFHYSLRTVFRLLASGENIFWRRVNHNSQILLTGVVHLVKDLNAEGDNLGRYFHITTVARFTSCSKRRAELYASTLPPKGIHSKPLARATVADITKVNPRQQRRYHKIAGIRRVAHFEVHCSGSKKPEYKLATREVVNSNGEIITIPKRLGNSYNTQQQPGHSGMLRKALKRCRVLDETVRLHTPTKSRFTSARRLLRAFTGGLDMGHFLTPARARIKPGRQEWCLTISEPFNGTIRMEGI